MMIFLTLIIPTLSYTLITNLQEERVLEAVRYCPYNITQDQSGWSARPPTMEWLNLTFPLWTHVQQITSVGKGISYVASYVVRFEVDYQIGNVKVSIVYWAQPWVVWLSMPYEKLCPEVLIQYGKRPGLK